MVCFVRVLLRGEKGFMDMKWARLPIAGEICKGGIINII